MAESWATLIRMAESAANGGRYNEAKDFYRQSLADADARRDVNNAYYSRCNFAGLLRLLDEYDEAEQLLRVAVKLRHDYPRELALEPISPITDLERILLKQKRLAELEQLHRSDVDRMFAVYGRNSHEFKMSLMNLAKAYGTHFSDMETCKRYFREVLDWSKTTEPVTRKMVFMTYDSVLRGAGLTDDAAAAQRELASLQQSNQE